MLLTIEKLIYGGDGLARGPADERGRGQAIFVPFALPGEQVEAEILERKPGFLRARLDRVLEPSPARIEPPCPYFSTCGGCQYQHTSCEHQLEIKTAILRETLTRISHVDLPELRVHASPPWGYRNRTRLKVRSAGGFALGYHRFNSHELLPVEQCPISSPLINRAIAAVWELGRNGRVSSVVNEIEFFANHDDTRLLVALFLLAVTPSRLAGSRAARQRQSRAGENSWSAEFAADFRRLLPEVAGVSGFRATRDDVLPIANSREPKAEMLYIVGDHQYRISAGSFFQVNRHLASTLLELVTAGRSGERALDLFAGAGLFTLPLARNFRQVTAVESSPLSYRDLKKNASANVRAVQAMVAEFLADSRKPRADCDFIVVDPPRGGLGEAVARALGKMATSRLTYVSCDPATLARDLKLLLAAGFRIEEAHLVDLFPQTFHIETVMHLVR